MLLKIKVFLPYFFILILTQSVSAKEATVDASTAMLVPFASEEGLDRLSRSNARIDFPALANQFEPQYNGGFCGPASAAIVLNALYNGSDMQPRDARRLQPEDLKYLPPQADITVPRFTQDTVIEKGSKSRAFVFGKPVVVGDKEIHDFGYQVRQLDEMLRENGAVTQLVVVSDQTDPQTIRTDLINNLKSANDFVLVNYKRSAVGQKGGGHISPVAAYEGTSDSFLVLDVNPAAAGWIWINANTLIEGMRTFDTVENRGYLLLSK